MEDNAALDSPLDSPLDSGPGTLEVGYNEKGEVVVNLDHDRTGHIIFSRAQAIAFGALLIRKAHQAAKDLNL